MADEVFNRVMAGVARGSTKEYLNFVKGQVPPAQLRELVESMKLQGNLFFRSQQYDKAIELYSSAIAGCAAGLQDNDLHVTLLCNISAAHLKKGSFKESLQYASDAIQLKSTHAKAWFRAAQVMLEKREFRSALKLLELCKIKLGNDAALQRDLEALLSKVKPLAEKERNLQRVEVDYSRFHNMDWETLEADENVAQPQAKESLSVPGGGVLEFAENVSEEQQRQLQQLLTGQQITDTYSAPKTLPRPVFYPECNDTQHSKKLSKKGERVRNFFLALCHRQSELTEPSRIASQHLTQSGLEQLDVWLSSLEESISSSANCLFVGFGVGVLVTRACQLLLECKENHDRRLYVCTNSNGPVLEALTHHVLECQDLPTPLSFVKIISKRVKDLQLKKTTRELDSELTDIPQADLIILDPSCFNSSGIGNQIIQDTLLLKKSFENAKILPQNLTLNIQLAQLKFEGGGSHDYLFKSWWNFSWETLDIERLSKNITFLTELTTSFSFYFNAEEICSEKCKTINFRVIGSGVANLIILKRSFGFGNNKIFTDSKKAAVLFMPTPLTIEESQVGHDISLEVSRSDTRLFVKLPPSPTPAPPLSLSLPRWQLLALCEGADVAAVWTKAVSITVNETMKERHDRMDKRPELSSSKSKNTVEILLLDSMAGNLALAAIQSAETAVQQRGSRPAFHYHVTALESSTSASLVVKARVREHWKALQEEAQKRLEPSGKQWHSFTGSLPQVEQKKEKRETAVDLLKLRFTAMPKNVRQLRPPSNAETARAQLAIRKIMNLSAGGVPLPPSRPDEQLGDLCDIIVAQCVDVGLLGEGILEQLWFASEALAKISPACKVLPSSASVYCVGVHLGPAPLRSTIHLDCWNKLTYGVEPALAEGPFSAPYVALSLDEAPHTILTEPSKVCDVNFCNFQIDQEIFHDVSLKVTQSGCLNAIVFWYILNLGGREPLTISTAPLKVVPQLPSTAQYPRQAAQFVEPLHFDKGEAVHLRARQTPNSIDFEIDTSDIESDLQLRKSFRSETLAAPALASWRAEWRHFWSLNEQLEPMYTDAKINKVACEALVSIAADAGAFREFRIDPEEVQWRALTLFS